MNENEVDLKDYLRVIAKRKWVVISVFLAAVIASGVVSFLLPPVYEVNSTLQIGRLNIGKEEEKSIESINTVCEALKGRVVLAKTMERLKLDTTLQELKGKIKVEPIKGTELIRITVKENDPQKAAQIANAIPGMLIEDHQAKLQKYKDFNSERKKVLEGYISEDGECLKHIKQEIEALNKKIESLGSVADEAKLRELKAYLSNLEVVEARRERVYEGLRAYRREIAKVERGEAFGIEPTELFIPARVPYSPIGPKKRLNVTVAAMLGLLGGLGLAFVVEYFEKEKSA